MKRQQGVLRAREGERKLSDDIAEVIINGHEQQVRIIYQMKHKRSEQLLKPPHKPCRLAQLSINRIAMWTAVAAVISALNVYWS